MATVTSLPFTLCYFTAPLSWEVLGDFENLDAFKLNHFFFYDLVSSFHILFSGSSLWFKVTRHTLYYIDQKKKKTKIKSKTALFKARPQKSANYKDSERILQRHHAAGSVVIASCKLVHCSALFSSGAIGTIRNWSGGSSQEGLGVLVPLLLLW